MFQAEKRKVIQILTDQSRFQIPSYQRAYNWRPSQVDEFLDDLKGLALGPTNDRLFLGNFIIQSHDDGTCDVVDGQQRLTTIMLLLIACRERAKALEKIPLAQEIQKQITFTDAATAKSRGTRLIASDTIRALFERMAEYDWDGSFPMSKGKKADSTLRDQRRRIFPVYSAIKKVLDEADSHQLSAYLRAIHESLVIVIQINDVLDALSIFERTNARGMDLEVSDLLKNYLFSKRVDGIEEQWSLIQRRAGTDLLRVLKYFYVSRKGLIRKSDLYRSLKTYALDYGADTLTTQLAEFADFFAIASSTDLSTMRTWAEEFGVEALSESQPRLEGFHWSLQALKEFGQVQYIPLVYAALMCARRQQGDLGSKTVTDAVIRLCDALERYHFINNVICSRVGNEVEQLYASRCVDLASAPSLVDIVTAIINDLRGRLATKDEFVANFVGLTYGETDFATLHYIFDRFANFDWIKSKPLSSAQCLPIFEPGIKATQRNWNIEHFYPQKSSVKPSKELEGALNNIGNLLVLYFKTNSSLGNMSPSEKVAALSGPMRTAVQNNAYVDRFLTNYGAEATRWSATTVESRAKEMAAEAYDKVWRL